MKHGTSQYHVRFIINLHRFFPDIFSFQHRNPCFVFFGILTFLKRLQCFRLLHKLLQFLSGKCCFIGSQLLLQFFFLLSRKTFLGNAQYNGGVRIIQQIIPDQLFKIPFICFLFQTFKCAQPLQMHKWLVLIIQPAVKYINSIHKSFREGRIICLPEAEFQIIDTCLYSLAVHAFFGDFLQGILDDLQKSIFIRKLCIFRHNGEEGLQNPIAVSAFNIFSDARIQQCLFQRCTRCRQQHIIQYFKSSTKFHIKCISYNCITAQIRCRLFGTIF